MKVETLIQSGAFLVALLTLIFQQYRQSVNAKRIEERLSNKMRIFFLCKNSALSEAQIIASFKGMNPTAVVDEAEIKKTIYEMLADETLRCRTGDEVTFRARRNKSEDGQ